MIPARQFIFAGRAVFTLTDLRERDRHYTYRINIKEPSQFDIDKAKTRGWEAPHAVWFVNIGIGYEDSLYAGMLSNRDQTDITFTRASRMHGGAPSMVLLQRFLKLAKAEAFDDNEAMEADGIRFQHEGKCCICARPLTHPESITMGIGPECRGKIGA
jgi:hypothetical protein